MKNDGLGYPKLVLILSLMTKNILVKCHTFSEHGHNKGDDINFCPIPGIDLNVFKSAFDIKSLAMVKRQQYIV